MSWRPAGRYTFALAVYADWTCLPQNTRDTALTQECSYSSARRCSSARVCEVAVYGRKAGTLEKSIPGRMHALFLPSQACFFTNLSHKLCVMSPRGSSGQIQGFSCAAADCLWMRANMDTHAGALGGMHDHEGSLTATASTATASTATALRPTLRATPGDRGASWLRATSCATDRMLHVCMADMMPWSADISVASGACTHVTPRLRTWLPLHA